MHFHTLLLPALAVPTILAVSLPLRVISFNIRYAASSLEKNEKPWWSVACPLSHNLCRDFHLSTTLGNAAVPPTGTDGAVVVGLQEVLDNQLSDILDNLGGGWRHVGVGRDDGAKKGEYNPILYDSGAFTLVHDVTKWLSETPDVAGSLGWDGGSKRIVTIAVLEHKATGRRFVAANTHLDNASGTARVEGIKVAVAAVEAVRAEYAGTGEPLGVTLTGDFNAAPGGDAYQTLVGLDYLTDSWETAKRLGTNQLTYTTFSDTGLSKIDYVWYGPNSESLFTADSTEILNNKVDGIYVSDHRLIYADLTLK